ncbi:MAG: hypothetical protein WC492_01155 [Candidatus Micrarchaeia archaeon]
MGKTYFDIIGGIKFAISQVGNMEMLKLGALYAFLAIIPSYGMAMITGSSRYAPYSQATTISPGASMAVLALGLVAVVLGLFNFFYVLPRIMRTAIKANGMGVPQKVPGVVEWFMLHLRLFAVDITCWYDKKLLIPTVVLLIIGIVAAFTFVEVGILFFMIAIFAWIIAMIIHGIRTTFSQYLLLRGDGHEGQMPRKSFDTIKGQTVEVFIPQFVFGVIAFVVAMVIVFATVFTSMIPVVGTTIEYIVMFALEAVMIAIGTSYMANMFKFFFNEGHARPSVAPAAATRKKTHARKGGKKK